MENPDISAIEAYFLQRFKTFGTPFLDKVPRYDIEWNFLMRHHLVPSRLLDWSKGSFIAMYLATRKCVSKFGSDGSVTETLPQRCTNRDYCKSSPDSAAVWILEPRRLSELCHGTRSVYGANDSKHRREIRKYFKPTSETAPIYPLPLIPDLVAPRIEAHVGRFTLHTLEGGGLERFAGKAFGDDHISYLIKVVIPSESHISIMRSLRSTGVSDMNFTQDLDGLAKELSLRINLGREDHNRFVSDD